MSLSTRYQRALAALALLAGVSLLSCGQVSTREFAADKPPELRVERGDLSAHILISGVLKASDSVAINSPTEGWGLAIRWLVEDGATVKKGERVLEMDAAEILTQLDAAESAYIKARSELAQQQNNAIISSADKKHLLRQAQSKLDKAKLNAAVPAEAYPRRVYEDMQLALKRAQSEFNSAQEASASETKISSFAVKQARVALAKTEREIVGLENKLKEYIISAPKDGVVIRGTNWRENRPYNIGDKTWPGQPILEMPKLSVMTVKAQLSDVDDGRIHIGMSTLCTLDAFPKRKFSGRITGLSPVATAPTWGSLRRAFEVEIELEETDESIMRPGMSVQVEVIDKLAKDVILAPRAGLLFEEDGVFALFAGGRKQSIEIGPCSAQQCAVSSGLAAGTLLQARSSQ